MGKREITEEIELGRTLLLQGHLDTAQKVLLKLCLAQPDCSEAFRILAMVLFKRGDDRRGQPLLEYADELDVQQIFETVPPGEDSFSDAKTMQTRRRTSAELRRPDPPKPSEPITRPIPVETLPQPVFASPPAPLRVPAPLRLPSTRRRGTVILFLFVVCAGAAGVVAYNLRERWFRPAGPSTRADLDRALASGSLEVLLRTRDVARVDLGKGTPDPDSLVRLGLVDALLANDYAIEPKRDTEDALRRAADAPVPSRERTSLVESARTLLALAAGDRAAAKLHAAAAMATPEPTAWAILAAARVRSLAGDATGAAGDLERARSVGPDLAPVIVDWASARLDAGDPVAARRALATVLMKEPDNSRARLGLAKAEQALGEPSWVKTAEQACRGDSKISRIIRSECAMQAAFRARFEGDRAGALQKAKTVAQTAEEWGTLADASFLMASLGDIDAAEGILGRARKFADDAAVPLLWANFAIRLGRGEVVRTTGDLEHPAGLERDLLVLRAAYGRGGEAAIALALKTLPPGIQDLDGDVAAFAALARPGGPSKTELASLEKQSDNGNPVASYVLGRVAMRDNDHKQALRRLEKALALHGDACQAGLALVEAAKSHGRIASSVKTALRAVKARNSKCPLPEL